MQSNSNSLRCIKDLKAMSRKKTNDETVKQTVPHRLVGHLEKKRICTWSASAPLTSQLVTRHHGQTCPKRPPSNSHLRSQWQWQRKRTGKKMQKFHENSGTMLRFRKNRRKKKKRRGTEEPQRANALLFISLCLIKIKEYIYIQIFLKSL